MSELIDLTGQKFGRLTVIKRAKDKIRKNGKHEVMWECLCDCGNTKIVSRDSLRSSAIRSCGCLRKENTKNMRSKHGLRNTQIYRTWANIKTRCYNPNKDTFNYYGGRNVEMCQDWKEDFIELKDEVEASGLHISGIESVNIHDAIKVGSPDRDLYIDNYIQTLENNCRWVTMKEQQNNKLNNHYIMYEGQKHTLMEWSEILNINYRTLHKRLMYLNWSIEKAFTTPIRKGTK